MATATLCGNLPLMATRRERSGAVHYRSGLDRQLNLKSILSEAFGRYGPRRALMNIDGAAWTYSDLKELTKRRAATLREIQARRVAIALPSQLETATWWLAALSIEDLAVTLIDPAMAADQASQILEVFAPDVLVTSGSSGLERDLAVDTAIPDVSTTDQTNSALLMRVTVGSRLVSNHQGGVREIVVTTSGTTGSPKLVVHSDETLGRALWTAKLLRQETLGTTPTPPPHDLSSKDLSRLLTAGAPDYFVYLNGMPVSTISGMVVLLQSLVTGATSVVADGFSVSTFLDLIETWSVTNLALSPHMAQRLVRGQRRSPRDTSALIATGIGGGPASSQLGRDVESVLGGMAAVGYGLTETAGPALMGRYSEPAEIRWATVGRPAPGVEAWLAPESGEERESGQLYLDHPALCHGYLESPGRVATARTENGLFRTGDTVHRRSDGCFVIEARASDRIVRGGRNIDHIRIERAIEQCLGVVRVAVVGIPNDVSGEQDIYAVLEIDDAATDLAAVRASARSKLTSGDRPQQFVQVEHLPTTGDLEIRRDSLRSRFGGKAAR